MRGNYLKRRSGGLRIRVLNQECTKSSWQIYRNCDIFKEVEVMKDAGNINVLWNFDKNELER